MGLFTAKMINPFKKKHKEQYRDLLEQQLGSSYFIDKHSRLFSQRQKHDEFHVEDVNYGTFSSGITKSKLSNQESKKLLEKIKNAGIKFSPPPLQQRSSTFFSQKNQTITLDSSEFEQEKESSPKLKNEEESLPESARIFNDLFESKKSYFESSFVERIKRDDYRLQIDTNQIEKAEQEVKMTREKRIEAEELFKPLRRKTSKSELSFIPYFHDEEEVEEDIEEENKISYKDFPEITSDMDIMINDALIPTPSNEVLSEIIVTQRNETLTVTRKDMETLSGLNWLNDEIINFYMALIVERNSNEDNRPSVYAFNTFFYPKLREKGHQALKRWTRKVDIFSFDFIFVPIHLGMHWCLAVIDFSNKNISYYDSMGGKNYDCLNALRCYLEDESLDKKKVKLIMDNWNCENVKDIPQQMNGSDCGMFTCKYAEYISRRAKFNFTQAHMPYFRRRMVYEILNKKLL